MIAVVMIVSGPIVRADGLQLDIPGARAVGRAGAVTVSEDGGAALFLNPAGMARREEWRAQIGMALIDRDLDYLAAPEEGSAEAPLVENRAPATRIPQLSVQGLIGRFVVGLTYLKTGAQSIVLPAPNFNQLSDEVARLYPHRYGGTQLHFRSRALAAGLAMRATSWLGIGVALGAGRAELREERRMWAGFAGRDLLRNPERDLTLGLDGTDPFIPRLVAGVLLAPPDVPLEMALSVSYTGAADLRGSPTVSETRQAEFPATELVAPENRLTLSPRIAVRSGVRYLGARFSIELGGEVELIRGDALTWKLSGVEVRDESSAVRSLDVAPAFVAERSRGGLRCAAEVEVVPGFLWLSGGYAVTAIGSPRARLSPVYADLGGHTLSAGVEGQWNGLAVSVGYARTMTTELTVAGNELSVVNPFGAGGGRTGRGRYRVGRDMIGVALEASWP